MAISRILGPDGEPIDLGVLTQELATPSLTGVRQVWQDSITSGMTPQRLVSILERAAQGDHYDFLTLAEDIEERELHYAALLGTRRRAISGQPITIEAASDDKRDVDIADACRTLIEDPMCLELLDDLLDALNKSYSVVEIIWKHGSLWTPAALEWRDPKWFMFDRLTMRELRLRDESDLLNGLPLPPYKYLVHLPRIKTGLPIRGGLARMAAFAWLIKNYALKNWSAFAEVFGMPLRLGRYGATANANDVAVLRRAVAAIGSDAAAVLPESMKIDFQEIKSTSNGDLYEKLVTFMDKQMSKGVLGQTMTTDDGSSLGQAKIHNEVRLDVMRADAKQLAKTINAQLIRPFVDLNFGPQKKYPQFTIYVEEPEDLSLLAESLGKLVPLGLRVSMSEVRDKFGLSDPDKDEDVLQSSNDGAAAPPALNRRQLALNSARQPQRQDAIDEIAAGEMADWHEQIGEIVDPVERLAAECETAEEFMRRLPQLAQSVDPVKLTEALARAAFKARGLGDATDKV